MSYITLDDVRQLDTTSSTPNSDIPASRDGALQSCVDSALAEGDALSGQYFIGWTGVLPLIRGAVQDDVLLIPRARVITQVERRLRGNRDWEVVPAANWHATLDVWLRAGEGVDTIEGTWTPRVCQYRITAKWGWGQTTDTASEVLDYTDDPVPDQIKQAAAEQARHLYTRLPSNSDYNVAADAYGNRVPEWYWRDSSRQMFMAWQDPRLMVRGGRRRRRGWG